MLYAILFLIVPVGSVLGYLNRKSLWDLFQILRYETVYWILGTLAIGDDFIWFWKNKLGEVPNKKGQIAIVTGGSRGIGFEVVKKLLECEMTVVIACRNTSAGHSAISALRASGVTKGATDVLPLDTASQAAVKKFAQLFLAKYDSLNLLINNAGIMFVPQSFTEDGFESQLAVNYLGHFTLSHLLMDALVRGAKQSGQDSRIVNVSSCAHLPGSINYTDINYQNSLYIPTQAYAQSKLAQVLFTNAVNQKLQEKKLPVLIYSLHPGVVNTELFNGTSLKKFFPWAPGLFFKRPDQGAITILFAALSPEVTNHSGSYYANCRRSFTSSIARDKQQQEKFLHLTEKLLQVEEFGNISKY